MIVNVLNYVDGLPSSRQKSRKGRSDAEARERERARELEKEAERERERQREKEIRSFREFSTKLPIKQNRRSRSRGSSFISDNSDLLLQRIGSRDGTVSKPPSSQSINVNHQWNTSMRDLSTGGFPLMPVQINPLGPALGSIGLSQNNQNVGSGYGYLGPIHDPSTGKSPAHRNDPSMSKVGGFGTGLLNGGLLSQSGMSLPVREQSIGFQVQHQKGQLESVDNSGNQLLSQINPRNNLNGFGVGGIASGSSQPMGFNDHQGMGLNEVPRKTPRSLGAIGVAPHLDAPVHHPQQPRGLRGPMGAGGRAQLGATSINSHSSGTSGPGWQNSQMVGSSFSFQQEPMYAENSSNFEGIRNSDYSHLHSNSQNFKGGHVAEYGLNQGGYHNPLPTIHGTNNSSTEAGGTLGYGVKGGPFEASPNSVQAAHNMGFDSGYVNVNMRQGLRGNVNLATSGEESSGVGVHQRQQSRQFDSNNYPHGR